MCQNSESDFGTFLTFIFLAKDAQPKGVGYVPVAFMNINTDEGPSESRGEHFLVKVC